jgi:diguanylate cyclase (GGDEF)-like protein
MRTHDEDPKPLVLLIDDSSLIHRLLDVRLRSEEIELLAVDNAEEGLNLAVERQPDLILLDLHMPGLDGFEALTLLKDNKLTVNIPVIVISGSDEVDAKVAGLELGAIDYVCKPFDFAELRARVRSAMRISHLMRLLSQRAQIDGLTGLWNRQYFDERLADELAHRDRAERPLTLCLCDLDHFKSLNDSFGHAAGDAALQGFARLVSDRLRRHDIACRYGGEEFGLILRDTSAPQAVAVLERIRADLAAKRWPRHPDHRLTASFGVFDGEGAGALAPQQWIEAADQALYAAKQAGRNRIMIADAEGRAAPAALPLAG